MIRGLRRGVRLSAESLQFSFDGQPLEARSRATASALLANGHRLVGRSFKYRRRRGLLTAGVEEPNALVTVGSRPFQVPNVPSPQLRLAAGMVITSQNRWPSLRFDLASLLQFVKGFLGAGFYYKTFMWPSWRFYDPDSTARGTWARTRRCNLTPPEVRYLDCDVLIAGGGPAGLTATLAAVRSGARVILCERDGACGGGALKRPPSAVNPEWRGPRRHSPRSNAAGPRSDLDRCRWRDQWLIVALQQPRGVAGSRYALSYSAARVHCGHGFRRTPARLHRQ